MIKQNVNIVNFTILSEILDEIKEKLSFTITKYNNEKDFLKVENEAENNSLIIMHENKKIQCDFIRLFKRD